MRYDSDHKSETRRRVLKEAAREIRAKGPGGVAVAGVMARAGLTHGGFYAHFESKEALIAAAIETMFESARSKFDLTTAVDDPRAALLAYVDFYLSAAHRDSREHGCPLPSLSGDLARLEPEARVRFGQGVAALTGRLAKALGRHRIADPEKAAAERKAIQGKLAATRGYPGLVGNIDFDKDRVAEKPAVIIRVQDGRWQAL